VDEPLSIRVFPGADGHFMLYEDDGTSFNDRNGDWMGVDFEWDDRESRLVLSLAEGSRMRPPTSRLFQASLVHGKPTITIQFDGRKMRLRLPKP
jgi:Domain of unknown function (DUF5110)